jgi:Tat protein secretion system quality control protein TatD with DNase activity
MTVSKTQTVLDKIKRTRDKNTRFKIIHGVAQVKAGWTSRVLAESLYDSSEKIRDFIVCELADRKTLNHKLIYSKLGKSPWYVKSSCLKFIALRKEPESIRYIEKVMDETNVEVRRSAAIALGEIGGDKALALLAELSKDKNAFVRKSAEKAINKASRLKFT